MIQAAGFKTRHFFVFDITGGKKMDRFALLAMPHPCIPPQGERENKDPLRPEKRTDGADFLARLSTSSFPLF